MIAADAGVAVGTLCRHFVTKEDLLEEVLRAGFEVLKDFLQTLLREADAWVGVKRLMRYIAKKQVSDQAFTDLLAAKPALRNTAMNFKRELGPMFAQIISRAQNSGKLRCDLVAGDLPMLLRGLPTDPGEAAARERYVDILLQGLKEPSRSALVVFGRVRVDRRDARQRFR